MLNPNHTKRRTALVASAIGLAAALARPPGSPAAARPAAPTVPAEIAVPDGHRAYLSLHATGTQNYICTPTQTGVAWKLFGPQATLFHGTRQEMTHYLSPNPDEAGTPRATWQHSKDSSAVWARATAVSTDPAFVAPGAIPWLRLEIVGHDDGPGGSDRLGRATFIQRVDTAGGVAPSTGCDGAGDLGAQALVPYTTDYVFFDEV